MQVVYDCETYPNVFTLCAEHVDYPLTWCFEISPWRDDSREIIEFVRSCTRMVGFNNVGFDYPILHLLLKMGKATAADLYEKAQAIITSQDSNRWQHMVYPSDREVEQIDLYKIHHFDNKARATSLKALEFNMRMENVSDLPFPVGSVLTMDQVAVLKAYNAHDVHATKLFYHKSLEQIRFREQLTQKHKRDFLNHNDTKIGAEIFQMILEASGVQCYEYGTDGRVPRQTKRDSIALKDCVPQWVQFLHPEFQRVKDWLNRQVITETKGVFNGLIAHVGGLDFIYGTGGLHASVEREVFVADDTWMIYDMDVTSLYPSIAIEHGHYPEHLGSKFVDVYRDLRTQRVGYKKGTAENAMLKLALNGVYGKSNDKFSIFYDPLFTMKITIGGQMMISLLAERLLKTPDLEIIQVNTDGVTVRTLRKNKWIIDFETSDWEKQTKLKLEYAEYSKMFIRDVNNYIAVKTDGTTKRKGAYEWKTEWHQNASALVIPKVAEKVMVEGGDIETLVKTWPDLMDFLMRVKVPRNSRLYWGQQQVQNTCRYYVSVGGESLTKVMPPLKGKTDERHFAVEKGWQVCVCNDLKDAVLPVNYDYYIEEVRKLCLYII